MKQHPQDYDKFVGIKQNNGKYKYRFTTTKEAMQAAYEDALKRKHIKIYERYAFSIKPSFIEVHRLPYGFFCVGMSDEIIKICEDPKSIKLDNALFWLANPKKMKYARSRGIFSDVPKKLLNSKLCMDNKLRGMGKVMFDV